MIFKKNRRVSIGVIFVIVLFCTILFMLLPKTKDRGNLPFSKNSYDLSKLEVVPFSVNSDSNYVPFYQIYPNGNSNDTFIICEGYENIKNKSIVSRDEIVRIIKNDNLKIIFFYLVCEQNLMIEEEDYYSKNTFLFTTRYRYNTQMTFSPVSIFFEQDKKFFFNGKMLSLDDASTYAQKVVVVMNKFAQQNSDIIVFLQHRMMWYRQEQSMRVVRDAEISPNDSFYKPFDVDFSAEEVEEIRKILDDKKAEWLLVTYDLSYRAFLCDPRPCFPVNGKRSRDSWNRVEQGVKWPPTTKGALMTVFFVPGTHSALGGNPWAGHSIWSDAIASVLADIFVRTGYLAAGGKLK